MGSVDTINGENNSKICADIQADVTVTAQEQDWDWCIFSENMPFSDLQSLFWAISAKPVQDRVFIPTRDWVGL
jgi:hypothetical protein